MEALKTLGLRWGIKISWNLYAPMRGKSIVDGFGGTVKRVVSAKIKSNEDLLIKCAEDFVKIADETNIKVILMKESEMIQPNKEIGLQTIIKNAKNIKDMKKMHSFEVKEVKTGTKSLIKVVAYKVTP